MNGFVWYYKTWSEFNDWKMYFYYLAYTGDLLYLFSVVSYHLMFLLLRWAKYFGRLCEYKVHCNVMQNICVEKKKKKMEFRVFRIHFWFIVKCAGRRHVPIKKWYWRIHLKTDLQGNICMVLLLVWIFEANVI